MGYNRIFFGYINQLYPSISPVCIPRDAAFHFPIFPSVDPLSFKEPEPVPTIFRQKKKGAAPSVMPPDPEMTLEQLLPHSEEKGVFHPPDLCRVQVSWRDGTLKE